MMKIVVALLLVVGSAAAAAPECEALFHRDVELVRDGEIVDSISISTRSGVVVIEAFNETEPYNVSVLVRFTGSTVKALSNVVERVTATDSTISVIAVAYLALFFPTLYKRGTIIFQFLLILSQ